MDFLPLENTPHPELINDYDGLTNRTESSEAIASKKAKFYTLRTNYFEEN